MKKKVLVSIVQYFTWVLCNVIFCVLPIGIICLIGKLRGDLNLSIVFSSILAFVFTLLIISLYTFSPFSRWRRGSVCQDLLIFGSFFVAAVILVVFVLYNVMPEAQQFMNDNMHLWLLLLLALVLVILLSQPAIEARILAKRGEAMEDAFNRSKQKGAQWINTITGGGG